MLYISNIDNYSFAMSHKSSSASDIEAVFPKTFRAYSVINQQGTENKVSILNADRDEFLVSQRDISEITLAGVVHTTKQAFVSAFNTLMATADNDSATNISSILTQVGYSATGSMKDHAEWGVHYLVDTDPAPTGAYYGFTPLSNNVAVSSITYIDASLQTGDNDFTSVTMLQGHYYPTPGLFSTITLSAGNAELYKYPVPATTTTTTTETTTTTTTA